MKPTGYAPLLALATLAACSSYSSGITPPPDPAHVTFTARGDSAAIAEKLDEFRAALPGALNAPNAPPAVSGRREINWDGAPAALTNIDAFPGRFFNETSKRGAVFITPGTGLRIDSTAFASVNAAFPDQFSAFSRKKLFMPVGTNRVEVDFELVGTTTAGLVNGFGVVFSDVDRAGSTHVDFLDANGARIARVDAPAHSGTHEFSFAGVVFTSAVVARVQIFSGDGPLIGNTADVSAGGPADLVAMDDFVYGEPQPVP